ncbi:MAG: hypothetical protein KIS66_02575 [Fimbriimonadaceae bacterium]|nr:hypothetical protein [Fimbriimonadaceae bacterium]
MRYAEIVSRFELAFADLRANGLDDTRVARIFRQHVALATDLMLKNLFPGVVRGRLKACRKDYPPFARLTGPDRAALAIVMRRVYDLEPDRLCLENPRFLEVRVSGVVQAFLAGRSHGPTRH